MAARGPTPKPANARLGHTKAEPEMVVSTPSAPGRSLPDDLLGDSEMWHSATLRWWETWCESSLTEQWTGVDWAELEACAVLHHQFMKKRTFTLASELRLRMAKFGATPDDRARLKIKLAPGAPSATPAGPSPSVTDIRSRRSRLSG